MSGNLSNSVFISYRRNVSGTLALAVYQDLHYNQIDAFYDITSLDAGQFDIIILNQIAARPYFVPILTPGTLQRCIEPGDWMLREIGEALRLNRMIVPLFTSEFDFGDMDTYLPREIAQRLRSYQGIRVPYANDTMDFFISTMLRLRTHFLNPIDLPILPTPARDVSIIGQKQALAQEQPPVSEEQLSAQVYFERALANQNQGKLDASIADYSEAIQRNTEYASAFNNRGAARQAKGDLDGAIADYNQALQLNPDYTQAYNNRGVARQANGNIEDAIADYNRALRLNPQDANAYNNRGAARQAKGDLDGAIADYVQALQLNPRFAEAYYNRGLARHTTGDLDGAIADYDQALHLSPSFAEAHSYRALAYAKKGE